MKIETLKKYCEAKGYNSRKFRFQIISELAGVTEEEAKSAERINRYLREIFPADEIGLSKEAAYHKPQYLHEYLTEEYKAKINQGQLI